MDNPNFIKNLEIKNYKSIKQLQMDCKRVNLFIGEPNVGKSNILESIALLSNKDLISGSYFGQGFLRYKKTVNELFYNKITYKDNMITVSTDVLDAHIFFDKHKYIYLISKSYIFKDKKITNRRIDITESYSFNKSGARISELNENNKDIQTYVKYYNFLKNIEYSFNGVKYLNPPNGDNLLEILNSRSDLFEYINEKFKKFDFTLSFTEEDELILIKKEINNKTIIYPFENTADTFQRLIFYIAAIETNNTSVILFEEPEVHSFPPYIAELAQRMVDKKDNQFFIATHSPYMFNEFIDNLPFDELNVNVVYYEDYQTKIRTLTEEEIKHASDIGTDIFFNLDRYVNS